MTHTGRLRIGLIHAHGDWMGADRTTLAFEGLSESRSSAGREVEAVRVRGSDRATTSQGTNGNGWGSN